MKSLPAGIPFRTRRGRPLIVLPALVNGKGPFHFILDTGASLTVLSTGVAGQLGIGRSKRRATALGAGGSIDARLTRIRSFSVGNLEVRNLHAAVMDLSDLRKSLSYPMDGIIGYNLLSRYRVTIDYPAKRLFFSSPPNREPPPGL